MDAISLVIAWFVEMAINERFLAFYKRICSQLTLLTFIHAKAVRPEQFRLLIIKD